MAISKSAKRAYDKKRHQLGHVKAQKEEYRSTHRAKYVMQRNMARHRGVPWEFTFESWKDWWGEDIDRRGNGKEDLCMARIGDEGPYHPVNVKKLTMEENRQEAKRRIKMNKYQTDAYDYAVYDDPVYPFLGLAEEAGEVCGVVAKHVRKAGIVHRVDRERVAEELGDVLWMVAACCTELGLSMEEVGIANLAKLEERRKKGTIKER